MKRSFAVPGVMLVIVLLIASGSSAATVPPKDRCVGPVMKTVKKGNQSFKAGGWFTRRLHRTGCLDRGRPKQFRAFSGKCKTKARQADSYLDALQRRFSARLGDALLVNQPRLVRLDRREIGLLADRRAISRQLRGAGHRRASLQRKLRKLNRELIDVRTRRARINYTMNTRAITRRGAAGVWLAYFDGVAHGCLKAFRGSPYLTVMREHFLVQVAAAQHVSPAPTRSGVATWPSLLSGRLLTPTGSRGSGSSADSLPGGPLSAPSGPLERSPR